MKLDTRQINWLRSALKSWKRLENLNVVVVTCDYYMADSHIQRTPTLTGYRELVDVSPIAVTRASSEAKKTSQQVIKLLISVAEHLDDGVVIMFRGSEVQVSLNTKGSAKLFTYPVQGFDVELTLSGDIYVLKEL